MNKFLLFSLLLLITVFNYNPAYSIGVDSSMRNAWGYASVETGFGEFVIAGSGGKASQGSCTYGDEGCIVSVIAEVIVEHGGYFCPYQLQCANKNKKEGSWTTYYMPSGFSRSKCVWLCEDGYYGDRCNQRIDSAFVCDLSSFKDRVNGKFKSISTKEGGGSADQVESNIIGFAQWVNASKDECDVVLGVTNFLEHGVIAAPVRVCCGREGWKDMNSFINTVNRIGTEKLLCAPGYKVNEAKTDCELIDFQSCSIDNLTACDNFDKEKYDKENHYLEMTDNNCVKFFCSKPGTAFSEKGNYTCETCSTGVKGGANPDTGVCQECETGYYFDESTKSCQKALMYSKTDLMYGKNETRNTTNLYQQCWIEFEPEAYINCVEKTSVVTENK